MMKKKPPSLSSSRDLDSPSHLSESPHSPLRFHSPLRSDLGDPPDTPPYSSPAASPHYHHHHPPPPPLPPPQKPATADRSPLASPPPDAQKPLPTAAPPGKEPPGESGSCAEEEEEEEEEEESGASPAGPPVLVISRAVREGRPGHESKHRGGGVPRTAASMRRLKVWGRLKQAGPCFRVAEVVLCMVSFSVMAADKTKGWSGDSFDRYKEYRYCLSVNVIAFVYASFQAFDLFFHMSKGKHVIQHRTHYYFNFFMDQILAYLLMSASSSAATRVDDWKSNWGSDKFTEMASASIAMSFLAFMAFAISSLISSYSLFIRL